MALEPQILSSCSNKIPFNIPFQEFRCELRFFYYSKTVISRLVSHSETRLGDFFKVLGINFCYKSSKIFGDFWKSLKTELFKKNCSGYFWKHWAIFIPTFGHTGPAVLRTHDS